MKDVVLDDLIKQDKLKNKLKNKQNFQRRNDQKHRGRINRRVPNKSRPESRTDKFRPNQKRLIAKDRNRPLGKKLHRIDRTNNRNVSPNDKKQAQAQKPHKKQQNPPQPSQQAQKQQKGRTLKVLGLHPDIKNEDLYKLFAAQGALQKCMIQQDNFGRNLPNAIVKYYSAETAKNAITNINGKKVLNSVLTVQPYKFKK